MLGDLGFVGAFIIVALIVFEVGNFFMAPMWLKGLIIAMITIAFGLYVRTPGRPLFIVMLLIMFPLATTELGTDSWIVDLMAAEMMGLKLQPAWILVYTALIMTVARYYAGPVIKKFNPVGLLVISSAIAATGLLFLSVAAGIVVFIAATIYGFAKSYLWTSMLGIVGERFPKGGALTLNVVTATGMITVGIVGAVFLGFVQDNQIDKNLRAYDDIHSNSLHQQYTQEKESIFGTYTALDNAKLEQAPGNDQKVVETIQLKAKKSALRTVAILPVIMTVCFIILYLYFLKRGGYKAIKLH